MNDTVERHEEINDLELIEEFKAGKEWAFNELVRRYSAKVLTLCTYYLKDREQAYDVSQEVFIKIYRALDRFRGASKLSTWIHTIAINTCKNKLSFWKRLTTWKKKFDEDPLTSRPADGPEDEVFRNERQQIVRREIAALPEIHRDIILLKDIQGCSYEEIGQILDITPGTVKSRLHRARDALAKRLEVVLGEDVW